MLGRIVYPSFRGLTLKSVAGIFLGMINRCARGKPRALCIRAVSALAAVGQWGGLMFTIEADFSAMAEALTRAAVERLPIATAIALTRTAQDVLAAEKAEMAKDFDRPTPWTLNALRMLPASPGNLVSEVRQKDDNARRDALGREVEGGTRRQKAFEKRLSPIFSHISGATRIVPADNAALDQYGNWSSGQRNQVLSALGAQGDRLANETARSRKRAAKRTRYFVSYGDEGNGGLPAGIYGRTPGTRYLQIIAIPVAAASYSPLFDFTGRAETTVRERLPAHFQAEVARTMARLAAR